MLSGIIARARSLWRGVRRSEAVNAEIDEEFRLHLELRTEDLIRSGLSPAKAARQARLEFGSPEHYKDAGRESRGLRAFDELRFSWLDFKLGFRMLVKYPGVTLIGGFALAFAVWVGAGTFEILTQVVNPRIPLDEGDRIVAIRNWDTSANRGEPRALHDFVAWRQELQTVEDLGAYRALDRNLIVGAGAGNPVEVAEISASAFRLARIAPVLGRTLRDDDERPGASPVVVIGYDVWTSRFAGDSGVVGQTVRLGSASHTVVGVMPKQFAFPVAHNVWTALKLNSLDYERRQGPALQIFGRLAPGASLDDAQAELSTVGRRAAADFPQTHQHLRPQVMKYAKSVINLSPSALLGLMSSKLFVVMLLVFICANVALLMFARAATREGEIVVRSALGASRGRIIMQLFAEALVLGTVAAVVALTVVNPGLEWALSVAETEFFRGRGSLPFWFRTSLSPATILYTVGLTLLGAGIAGVVPGLKVTRSVEARLKHIGAGGGGLQFGGLWTAIIVTQVAVTVAFPAVPFFVRRDAVQIRTHDVGFQAEQFLSARVEMDREALVPSPGDAVPSQPGDTSRPAFRVRYSLALEELKRRLASEPGVTTVTFANHLPRTYHGWNLIEMSEGAPLDGRVHRPSSAEVDLNYFAALDAPILSGRGFHAGDVTSGARVALVNQPFVDRELGGRNPLGRRLRYIAGESLRNPGHDEEAPWYEIVGVVRDLGTTNGFGYSGIYHPLVPGTGYPLSVAVHVRGDARAFTPRLRAVALAADPGLRLYNVERLDEVTNGELELIAFWFRLTTVFTAIVLLLSLSGIYAVTSFAVSRRTREIGIRVALGADRQRILATIFRKPLTQIGVGVAAGAVLIAGFIGAAIGDVPSPTLFVLVAAYAGLMMAVCMLACIVPTRRALGVEPTEALRFDQ